MPTPYSVFSGANYTSLTNALLAPNSGVNIVSGSVVLDPSGPSAVNFYDGSLAPLGIGAGLLLTSGTTPGMSNTVGWFGTDNSGSTGFSNGDADINAVVNSVFQTQSYDATTLAFEFTVADPTATSVSFDLVFGSDEYPEWVDQFVDSAVVMVNGVNYALFNHDPMHPLSVVSSNLAAGYFINNANSVLPIEYDGVSHLLKIVAPIHAGTNSIKIGIADTGDHIYDSGIFIANLSAGTIPGSGVVIAPPTDGTDNSDTLSGTAKDEYFNLKGGDDIVYAGAGDDIVVAGSGNDAVYGGSGNDEMKGDGGDDVLDGGDGSDTAVYSGASSQYSVVYDGLSGSYQITDSTTGLASEASDTLINTELVKFSDGLFQLAPGGLTPVTTPGGGSLNNAGTVVITGIGSIGNTLVASVNDLDGVPATVNYQWQALEGGSWVGIGGNSNSYTVMAGDAGLQIRVIAEYLDNGATAEAPISAEKTILATNNGDLVVTLMQLSAPLGASTMNPLTTLMQDAMDLGITSNVAGNSIKAALGIDASVNLLHYDAWAVLQADPNDAIALAVEMISVQVAILTSLSDDDTGVSLTLALLGAAENGQQFDLANANDLAAILGIDITGITDKNLYPQPLREIFDRNITMAEAIADGNGIAAIEQEWLDLLTIQSGIASTSIADLSIHINQAPIGSAIASLQAGTAGAAYLIASSDLLAGFSDPDGDALSVVNLTTNTAGTLQDNGDGTWTFKPEANFSGPVELTYTVADGLGGTAPGSQMFVMPAVLLNNAPTLANALADQTLACKVAFSFTLPAGTFADVDAGDTLTYTATLADGSALPAWLSFAAASGTFSGTPGLANVGALAITVTATDAAGASVSDTFLLDVASLIEGTAGNDKLIGTSVDDRIYGHDGNDSLYGYGGADQLYGGAGNDTLNGGLGADTMRGGLGNDAYYVDAVGDAVIENADEGSDRVISSISYALGANLENLTLSGTAAIDGTGNDLNNSLTGNAGNNLLQGGAGNDALNGGAGDDTMQGGLGNDAYYVDAVGDAVIENAGEGSDRVISSLAYALGMNLENLTLSGTAAIDGSGNELNNSLTGNSAANSLFGDAGNDTLTGGGGADQLNGGIGTDSANYGASTAAVQVNLATGLGTGGDAEGDTLAGIENLTGSAWDDTLIGDAGNNSLAGNAGNDILEGGSGNDALTGGGGADQLDGGVGTDSANYGASTAAVQVNLVTGLGTGGDAEGDVLAGIENLTGSAWDDTLIGNALANYLAGNAGHDSLMGGDGNDVLNGGRGNDQLSGGSGKDVFRFADMLDSSENLDTILDFNSVDDTIQLARAVFDVFGQAGKLSAANFSDTGTAQDGDDYIVYNQATGSLSYDSDGNGLGAAMQFATLVSPTGLVAGDFVVI